MGSSQVNISVLGSTGSIGVQTLAVVDQFPNLLHIVGLSAGTNLFLLQKQIKKYRPKAISVKKEEDMSSLQKQKSLRIYWGDYGNCTVATLTKVNIVVIATSGLAGIGPTIAAI